MIALYLLISFDSKRGYKMSLSREKIHSRTNSFHNRNSINQNSHDFVSAPLSSNTIVY